MKPCPTAKIRVRVDGPGERQMLVEIVVDSNILCMLNSEGMY